MVALRSATLPTSGGMAVVKLSVPLSLFTSRLFHTDAVAPAATVTVCAPVPLKRTSVLE